MKKATAFIIAALMLGMGFALAAQSASAYPSSAYPWYSNTCSGCASTVYTLTPYTHNYYGSYSYGYSGWGDYKVHYHYRYPHYSHYYPYNWHYPYAYNYYPSPMYNTGGYGGIIGYGGFGSYGPGIIW